MMTNEEAYGAVEDLGFEFEYDLRVDFDDSAPMPVAIWVRLDWDENDEPVEDIIGAGATVEEAIAEARAQLAAWASGDPEEMDKLYAREEK